MVWYGLSNKQISLKFYGSILSCKSLIQSRSIQYESISQCIEFRYLECIISLHHPLQFYCIEQINQSHPSQGHGEGGGAEFGQPFLFPLSARKATLSNPFRKILLKKYGKKLIPIQNT